MINNIYSNNQQLAFGSRNNLRKDLPKIRTALKTTLKDVQSPNRMALEGNVGTQEFKDANNKLGFVRGFLQTLYEEGGLPSHFTGLIGLTKAFKVANCSEYAEITDTVLKANGIKSGAVFDLWAKSPNSAEPPRALDHAITVVNTTAKRKKQHNKPFLPPKNTKIIDMWVDGGYIGNLKDAKKHYAILGLKPDEQLLIRPIRTFTPDKASLDAVKKENPTLIIK